MGRPALSLVLLVSGCGGTQGSGMPVAGPADTAAPPAVSSDSDRPVRDAASRPDHVRNEDSATATSSDTALEGGAPLDGFAEVDASGEDRRLSREGDGAGALADAAGDRSQSGLNPAAAAGTVERIRGGFQFTEGPVWVGTRGFLLFSDLMTHTIHRFTPPSTFEIFRKPSNRANGLALDPEGRLVICETATKRVVRSTLDGMPLGVLADKYEGRAFGLPNDVVVRSDGTIYFTDVHVAVYRIDPRGIVHLVSNTVKPNGIALSPDERTLYTSHNPQMIWQFPVAADGSTGLGKRLSNISADCDGMAVDDAGNLYVTVDSGIQVLKPGGENWGTIPIRERPANCSFGGKDRKTLFVTARTGLYRVAMSIPGLP